MVFSNDNYIAAIILLIMILLAVIGYFAERANNKSKQISKKEDNKELIDLSNKRLSDFQISKTEEKQETVEEVKEEEKEQINQGNISTQANVNAMAASGAIHGEVNSEIVGNMVPNGNIITESRTIESVTEPAVNTSSFEKLEKLDKIEQMDKELDILLPEEKLLNEDLLTDIDLLELDKTQKLDLSELPDLDNIDLPKIMKMEEEEDIWKF